MKRLLFVDDEPHVLDGLRNLLFRHRKKWEMVFALGGEAGLNEIRAKPFDVVITDMVMPYVDGPTLLAEVRHDFPKTVRIVLSGYAEEAAALRAASVAHQFLSKPCDVMLLEKTIERTCEVIGLIADDRVREIVGRIDTLPSEPRIYTALVQKLKEPNTTSAHIAALLEQDMALCAKILQVSNSAFFGLPRRITRVENAVSYLGQNVIKNLVLSLSVFSADKALRGVRIEGLQRNALMVGSIARRLVSDPKLKDDAFLAGMLLDFGVLVLATHLPDHFERTAAALDQNPRPLQEVEQELWGFTHAELGAYLIGLWNLPHPVVEAVALHHRLDRGHASELLAAVHAADVLAWQATPTARPDHKGSLPTLDLAYLEAAGVAGQVDGWQEIARLTLEGQAEAA